MSLARGYQTVRIDCRRTGSGQDLQRVAWRFCSVLRVLTGSVGFAIDGRAVIANEGGATGAGNTESPLANPHGPNRQAKNGECALAHPIRPFAHTPWISGGAA